MFRAYKREIIFVPVLMVTRTSATPSHLHLQHHHRPPPPPPPRPFPTPSEFFCLAPLRILILLMPTSHPVIAEAASTAYSHSVLLQHRCGTFGSSVHVACAARSINNDKIAFPHMDRANVVFDSDFGLGLAFGFGYMALDSEAGSDSALACRCC